eukprot:TRINITY_DN95420_c0_g1_i1.p1 TRINITY_DN95420_c0_g1~~TRINITY_DN95420_c0_g1_i1.p1  ORF type:complete len:540 (-),score=46.26 TRINITY_DN95420_c0_g1_i1:14-1465(-)
MSKEGVILNNYYVNPICTPTRTSFMSGMYPIHVGLQHGVIKDAVPNALPINQTIVPQYMNANGYVSHIIGKWHLGFYEEKYTPERRGFATHFGYYTGNEEYWNHTSPCWHCGNYTALDLHWSNSTHFIPTTNQDDNYSTHLFTQHATNIIETHDQSKPLFLYLPYEAVHGAASCAGKQGGYPNCNDPKGDLLQAPQYYIDQQKHIKNIRRRTFAGMVGALDDAVKNITEALKKANMLSDTFIIFTTDNGAPNHQFGGGVLSNWPLRGGKATEWEGGVRGASFIWGYGINKDQLGKTNTGLMHASDWMPTLVHLVTGKDPKIKGIDGVSQWEMISAGKASQRNSIVHNIDPITNHSAIRVGKYKLLVGQGHQGWGPNPHPGTKCTNPKVCRETQHQYDEMEEERQDRVYLFDIEADPQERHNLASSHPNVLNMMLKRWRQEERSAVPCRNPNPDKDAQPTPIPGLIICTEGVCRNLGVWKPWNR